MTNVKHVGPGDYHVTFNRSVQPCAGVATVRGTADNEFYGFITTYMPADKVIRVVVRDADGKPADGAGFNLVSRMLRRAGLMIGLALCASLAACGGDDDDAAKPVSAAAGSALLAQIPTLGETYPAQLARFVDTDEGKDYGLAVTVADDGKAVAYLCDGKTLGRAFSGAIEDGADSATLKAVKGDGTVDLELAGDEPSSATVKADDFSDEFTLASTKVGGYYREEVKGVARGWVVSDALAIKGVSSGNGKPVKGTGRRHRPRATRSS